MISEKYKVLIENTIEDDKVIYRIIVRSDTDEKVTHNRYSQLKDFHDQVTKSIYMLKLQMIIPEFPKRKLFGSTNKSQESILSRQIELQNYFNELFSVEKVLNLPPVQKYLPGEQKQQEWKIAVTIERYSVYDDVVVYFMRFRNKNTKEEWVYKQRYSEIKNMHEALIAQGFKNKLPPFPQRKLFGMTNENPETIEKRREDLETYLNALFSTQEIYQSEVIQYLIAESQQDYQKSKKIEQMKRNSQQKGDLNVKVQQIQQKNEDLIKQEQ